MKTIKDLKIGSKMYRIGTRNGMLEIQEITVDTIEFSDSNRKLYKIQYGYRNYSDSFSINDKSIKFIGSSYGDIFLNRNDAIKEIKARLLERIQKCKHAIELQTRNIQTLISEIESYG